MFERFTCAFFNETAYSSIHKIYSRKSKSKCFLNETETRYRLMMVYTNEFHAYLITAVAAGDAQVAHCRHSLDHSNGFANMYDEISLIAHSNLVPGNELVRYSEVV